MVFTNVTSDVKQYLTPLTDTDEYRGSVYVPGTSEELADPVIDNTGDCVPIGL
jgi:hypothetical protein